MGYNIFSKIFTRYNLCKDLDKMLVADLSDTSKIYKCNLTLQDLCKILLAYPKISRSCLQDVSLGLATLIRAVIAGDAYRRLHTGNRGIHYSDYCWLCIPRFTHW